jgi:hypothetical protein
MRPKDVIRPNCSVVTDPFPLHTVDTALVEVRNLAEGVRAEVDVTELAALAAIVDANLNGLASN